MTSFYTSVAEVEAALGRSLPPEVRAAAEEYPPLLNSYLLGLFDPAQGEHDPIWQQVIPAAAELGDFTSDPDPLAEEAQMLCPRMVRRFRDRVAVLVTGKCAAHCRFCFRKRLWKRGASLPDLSDAELAAMVAALRATPEVREVLLTGGDPSMLPTGRLREVIAGFSALEQVNAVRLGTRAIAMFPQRFDGETVAMLSGFEKLWIMTHFNHPRELTPEAEKVCRELVKNGVPLLNQTVLLKGVNDSEAVLEELFRRLVGIKVKPHYLFHVDPVRGVRHFATGVARGLEIMRNLRGRLSSLATPNFAIDLPEGGGKVWLTPNCFENGGYWDVNYRKIIKYPEFKEECK